jgi:hypothetical protein
MEDENKNSEKAKESAEAAKKASENAAKGIKNLNTEAIASKNSVQDIVDGLQEAVFRGRDLTDEVKELTKRLFGVGEVASQINKTFRDLSKLERNASDGMLDILDGSRKISNVQKDIIKNEKLQTSLTSEKNNLIQSIAEKKKLISLSELKTNPSTKDNKSNITNQLDLFSDLSESVTPKVSSTKEPIISTVSNEQDLSKTASQTPPTKEDLSESITPKVPPTKESITSVVSKEQDLSKTASQTPPTKKDNKGPLTLQEEINLSELLLEKINERIEASKELGESLKAQNTLLEKGVTPLAKGLEGVQNITKSIPGMSGISKIMEESSEGARLAAINGANFAGQLKAARIAAQALVTEMILLALVTSGLKYDEQVSRFQRDMGISVSEARKLRVEMSKMAAQTEHMALNTKDFIDSTINLQKQFGSVGTIIRKDIVEEMANLAKTTNLSAESQGSYAGYALRSGKAARTVTYEARQAVQLQQKEKGLLLDINRILDEAGKVRGQISAQLGGDVTKISAAIALAEQYGMTLEQVAASGKALLNFETSIGDELKAELLTGKQLNLEKARLAALTGDYETLTREINKNVGDFGDFTKMNVLQQEALAASVGMTADGLSDVLLKGENIEELAQEARLMGDEDLAKSLEKRAAQDKFNDALDKMKAIFTDIVGGPMGLFLEALADVFGIIGKVFGFISNIGNAITIGGTGLLNWVITLAIIAKTLGLIKSTYIAIKTSKLASLLISKKQAVSTQLDLFTTNAKSGAISRNIILGRVESGINRVKALWSGVDMSLKMGAKTFGVGAIAGAAITTAIIGMLIGGAMAAATGADFETKGPMPLIVGDNPGGRERVTVTPINSENKYGPSNSPPTDMSNTNNILASMAADMRDLRNQPKFESIWSQRGQSNGSMSKGQLKHGSVGDSFS